MAKLLIFWSLLETGHAYLALAAILYILPGVYYYFRMVTAMWVREPGRRSPPIIALPQKWALAAMATVALFAGIFPEQFLQFAKYSMLLPLGR
jgi:NADH:ubiquinone oxidoreductase subunit 2 (subunit N)